MTMETSAAIPKRSALYTRGEIPDARAASFCMGKAIPLARTSANMAYSLSLLSPCSGHKVTNTKGCLVRVNLALCHFTSKAKG